MDPLPSLYSMSMQGGCFLKSSCSCSLWWSFYEHVRLIKLFSSEEKQECNQWVWLLQIIDRFLSNLSPSLRLGVRATRLTTVKSWGTIVSNYPAYHLAITSLHPALSEALNLELKIEQRHCAFWGTGTTSHIYFTCLLFVQNLWHWGIESEQRCMGTVLH